MVVVVPGVVVVVVVGAVGAVAAGSPPDDVARGCPRRVAEHLVEAVAARSGAQTAPKPWMYTTTNWNCG